MITRQGKEVNYSDILLYNVSMNNIVVIVNDEDQIKKFTKTGNYLDAPVVVLPYSEEELNKIIINMKKIDNYHFTDNGNIEVKYTDDTVVKFHLANEKIIKLNLEKQNEFSQRQAVAAWYNIPEIEKEKKKREAKRKFTKSLSVILAGALVAGGIYLGSKFGKNIFNSSRGESTSQHDNLENNGNVNQNEVRSDFSKEAETLYNATLEINPFILKYQQVANVTWDKELALEVVEYLNGVYPTAMLNMNDEDAKREATEVMQAINLIIAGNLNPETKETEIIDLSQYITNEKEKVFVHNAMIIAKACMQESIGEPMNGKILDESEWSSVNKFSRQYTNAVDQLLHYEFDTINDPDFLTSTPGARFVIGTIFKTVNGTIPQWSYVVRESSEQDTREYKLYYRYFSDDYEKKLYLPEPGQNGTTVYYAHWSDETNPCHKEGPYTEDVMFAMAGLSLLEEQRNLGIEANPNIRQLGIQTEVDNRVEDARTELFELRNTYVNSK